MDEQKTKNEKKPQEELKVKTKISTGTLILLLVIIIGIGAFLGYVALYTKRNTPATDSNPPGNTNTPVQGPSLRDGWPVSGFGNPVEINVVSTNNSYSNQKGIVVANENTVTVLNPSGLPFNNWPKQIESVYRSTVPVTGDIDGDGQAEIITSFCKSNPLVCKIYVWKIDGNVVVGWPKEIINERIETPDVLADLNKDGKKEIVVITSASQSTAYSSKSWLKNLFGKEVQAQVNPSSKIKIYVFTGDGNLLNGWPKEILDESVSSTTAVGNIDSETNLEIVVCGFNKIYAFHTDGSGVTGWPIDFRCLNVPSPVITDLGTKENYRQVIAYNSENESITVWNGDGSIVDGWPKNLDIRVFSLVAAHFIPRFSFNADNKLKDVFIKEAKAQIYPGAAILVAGPYSDWQTPNDPTSKIYAFTSNGQVLAGWPVSMYGNDVFYKLSVADTDKNGVKIFATTTTTLPEVPTVGKIYAYNTSGQVVNGWPIQVSENYPATPTFTDLDNNSYLEMIVRVMDKIYVWNLNTNFEARSLLWPMFLHDTGHTNTYLLPSIPPTYPNIL